MNLSNIIGKQIYTIYEGEMVGTILAANFNYDYKRVIGFTIFNKEDDEFYLPISNIKSIGDFVIISNKTKLQNNIFQTGSPMYTQILDNDANDCGRIIDIDINNSGVINHYITSNSMQVKPNSTYVRKDFIYYSPNKVFISNYKPRSKKVDPSKIVVKILNDNESATRFIPSKIQYNPESILGWIAKGDLFGFNNEIIIKTNQTITKKTIDDAIKHNRLNQLYYIAN